MPGQQSQAVLSKQWSQGLQTVPCPQAGIPSISEFFLQGWPCTSHFWNVHISPFRPRPQGLSGMENTLAAPGLRGPALVRLPGWPEYHSPAALPSSQHCGSPAHDGAGVPLCFVASPSCCPRSKPLALSHQSCTAKFSSVPSNKLIVEALVAFRNMWTSPPPDSWGLSSLRNSTDLLFFVLTYLLGCTGY